MNKTLAYYNEHASDFVNQTLSVDMRVLHDKFLSHIPKNGRILDAGCGSARDAKAFHQIHYDVEAFDASEAIVDLVNKHCDFPIYHASFLSFYSEQQFDGIWACASLLHATMNEQVASISHLSSMLKNNGVFYLSYKLGNGEKEHNGRYFCNFDEQSFSKIAQQLENLSIIEQWITTDQRKDREQEQWFNIILRKEPSRRE
jgi:SAM-dependent methyltransferase